MSTVPELERAIPWHHDDLLQVGPYRLVYRTDRQTGRIDRVYLPGHVERNRAGGASLMEVLDLARRSKLVVTLPTVRR